MKTPDLPFDETQRLSALHNLKILDTPREERFDRLTRLAARTFNVPVSLISLVDENRQWFKSCFGVEATETSRDVSFCAHAIHSDQPLIIEDARLDARFADNPMVVGEPLIRFYAGYPLKTLDGFRIGTICLIDQRPRQLTMSDLQILEDLGKIAENELNTLEMNQLAMYLAQNERKLQSVIFDMKLAETALRKSEEQFRTLVSNMGVGVLLQGAHSEMLMHNQAALNLLGISAEQLMGTSSFHPSWRVIHEDGTPFPPATHPVPTCIATGIEVRNVVMGVYRPNQANWVWLQVDAVPLKDEQNQVVKVICTFNDISDRKQIEKMKNEFVATVSHELRTPLTSIRGALGLLNSGTAGDLDPSSKTMIGIAHKNSERLVRLVNDILDVEQISQGSLEFEMQLMLLQPLLEQAVQANQNFADQFKVRYELINSLPGLIVRVDADRLMQVLTNLLSNAAKFSPANQVVKISVSMPAFNLVRIGVSDNGPGIPNEFRGRIFQQFSQADSSSSRHKGGTGLGLSISKAIVEKLGGTIGYYSEYGNGATFYFDLPVYSHAPVVAQPVA